MMPFTSLRGPGSAAAWLALIPLLAACAAPQPPATATPRPTVSVLEVALAGELDPLRPVVAACAAAIPDFGILVFSSGAGDNTALEIVLGEPELDGLQAALLGWERIVAIVAAGNRLDSLSADQLRLAYSGAVAGSELQELWAPLPGSQSRSALDRLLGDSAYSPEAFLAPDPPAMLEAVSQGTGAVGVLPAAWLTDEVRPVLVLAELPVLAVTDGTPLGKLRELIGCLQQNPVYSGQRGE